MKNPRTPKTEAAYQAFKAVTPAALRQQFDLSQETIIREYQHWVIITSRFPYDQMVRVNDMLVLRRAAATRQALTADEQAEYDTIVDEITSEHTYDAMIENFPRTQSVPGQLHVHLVCWHDTAS